MNIMNKLWKVQQDSL